MPHMPFFQAVTGPRFYRSARTGRRTRHQDAQSAVRRARAGGNGRDGDGVGGPPSLPAREGRRSEPRPRRRAADLLEPGCAMRRAAARWIALPRKAGSIAAELRALRAKKKASRLELRASRARQKALRLKRPALRAELKALYLELHALRVQGR